MSTYSDDPFASWGSPSTSPPDSDGDARSEGGVNRDPFYKKYAGSITGKESVGNGFYGTAGEPNDTRG